MSAPTGLVTRRLLGPSTLLYFYRRRLRAHGIQELLAGVGIAAAVALVLAANVAQGSIADSTGRVLRAVAGPADLQLRTRGADGFPQSLLGRVEQLRGVRQAAPLLERSIRVIGRDGTSANIFVAGTDTSLAVLNGLGKTLPLGALSPGTIGLSRAAAEALGLGDRTGLGHGTVTLLSGGVRHELRVSAVLGRETVGALSGAQVGVMPLSSMQSLLETPGMVTRILVRTTADRKDAVAAGLRRLAHGRLIVSSPEEDLNLLKQALRPSGQASDLFAVIGALLGFLLAFNAILLTVPERRHAIADLRLAGTRRSAIIQLAAFQAICLGAAASAVGVGVGYVLSRWVFHQSTGYLQEAFTLSGGTVVSAPTLFFAVMGGVLVTLLASSVPLLDLRRGTPRDTIYMRGAPTGDALAPAAQRRLIIASIALLVLASVLFAAAPSSALLASVALAIATVLAVPVAFAAVLAAARALSERAPRLSTLAIALGGVRGTTLRSLALAATGAVALFGSVALGGARANLLSGIQGFARSYASDAAIWIGEPDDNQATQQLAGNASVEQVERVAGVASVQRFQGAFLTVGRRRVWVIARPPGRARNVLATQTISRGGAGGPLYGGGRIAVSRQIASEHHTGIGGSLTLPTPAGSISFRISALTTNLAWSPGVVFMDTTDFSRAWGTNAPSALAVSLLPGSSAETVRASIVRALGPRSGLEVATAATRQDKIDALTGEGLGQLGTISTLLLLAAIMALAAALASSIDQRRVNLASLRLAGAAPARLRRILLVEAGLILGTGCVTGALAGVYGQFVIDAYLRHITGFPVAGAGASARPLEIFALVLAATLVAVALPGWRASRVSPALALEGE